MYVDKIHNTRISTCIQNCYNITRIKNGPSIVVISVQQRHPLISMTDFGNIFSVALSTVLLSLAP